LKTFYGTLFTFDAEKEEPNEDNEIQKILFFKDILDEGSNPRETNKPLQNFAKPSFKTHTISNTNDSNIHNDIPIKNNIILTMIMKIIFQ